MQQQQQQQGFPMVPVMQPNMQGMMGMNFGAQMPTGPMPMQVVIKKRDFHFAEHLMLSAHYVILALIV